MKVLVKILEITLLRISEWEAHFATPRSSLWFRQLYLKVIGVVFQKPIWIGSKLWIRHGENLRIGKRCAFGEFTRIIAHAPILIGDEFIAASGLSIDSGSHDPITMEPLLMPIEIGNRVWCGTNVTILPGVTIGNDVVIGAGSVVCKDIPPKCIAVGCPAKYLRDLDRKENQEIWTWLQAEEGSN